MAKEGFPQEGELLLCTVTKIFGHSVFVNIESYNKQGMIHISEISPGRIRNLRDYVVEGKRVVCVVLRINQERGHIDLSLRRVNENQRRKKLDEIKQEQKAKKMLEGVAKTLKLDPLKLFEEVKNKIYESYESLNDCFVDVVMDKTTFEEVGLSKKVADKLTPIIKDKIKPPRVSLGATVTLHTTESNGIEIIKKVLTDASKPENVIIRYAGDGNYTVIVEDDNYKSCEKGIDAVEKALQKGMQKHGEVVFTRQ